MVLSVGCNATAVGNKNLRFYYGDSIRSAIFLSLSVVFGLIRVAISNKLLVLLLSGAASIMSPVSSQSAQDNALCALIAATNIVTTAGRSNWICSTSGVPTSDVCGWTDLTCTGSAVTQIYLLNGDLTGTIPTQLGQLTFLTFFLMGQQSLTGTIPTELGQLTSVEMFNLFHNSLTGTVPTELSQLTSAEWFSLSSNSLVGSIPTQLGQLSAVTRFDVSYNDLTGTLPVQLASLTRIIRLYVNFNDITGTIPTEFGHTGPGTITLLNIGGNSLTGTIPTELGLLATLSSLDILFNDLTGSVPSELCNIGGLSRLSFGDDISCYADCLTTVSTLHIGRSSVCTVIPSSAPSSQPSGQPSVEPSGQPTRQPSVEPSGQPTILPSISPISYPTGVPSGQPSGCPSNGPSSYPSSHPSAIPSVEPTVRPSCFPTALPSSYPSACPSSFPTCPSGQPSSQPSCSPSGGPSGKPTAQPSSYPSSVPSANPTRQPSRQPTGVPSSLPTSLPTCPSGQPSSQPSNPSGQPSGQPSGEPTCGFGSSGDRSADCSPCLAGQYRSSHDNFNCILCSKGTYNTVDGSEKCDVCENFPFTTVFEGEVACNGIYLGAGLLVLLLFNGMVVVMYTSGIMCVDKEKRLAMFVISLLPTIDIVSDMNYIITTRYFNLSLFIISVFFVIIPNLIFVRKLFSVRGKKKNKFASPMFVFKAYPGFELINENVIWLRQEEGCPVLFNDQRLMFFDNHQSIPAAVILLFSWGFAILIQILCIFLFAIWFCFASLFAIGWFCLGVWFFQSKALATKQVWNFWFRIWTWGDEFEKSVEVDVNVLNESLFAECVAETLPQLVLQFTNNEFTKNWSFIAVFSMVFSVSIALNGFYRYCYWVYFMGYELYEVPAEASLMGLFAIKLAYETEVLEGPAVVIPSTYKMDKLAKRVWSTFIAYNNGIEISVLLHKMQIRSVDSLPDIISNENAVYVKEIKEIISADAGSLRLLQRYMEKLHLLTTHHAGPTRSHAPRFQRLASNDIEDVANTSCIKMTNQTQPESIHRELCSICNHIYEILKDPNSYIHPSDASVVLCDSGMVSESALLFASEDCVTKLSMHLKPTHARDVVKQWKEVLKGKVVVRHEIANTPPITCTDVMVLTTEADL